MNDSATTVGMISKNSFFGASAARPAANNQQVAGTRPAQSSRDHDSPSGRFVPLVQPVCIPAY